MTGSFPSSNPESQAGRLIRAEPSDLTAASAETLSPLLVSTTSSGIDTALPDSEFSLGVTLQNQGDRDAVVDVWIDPRRSPVLGQWCTSNYQRLALGVGQSGEVVFTFQIPGSVVPDQHDYDLLVDATSTYAQLPPTRYAHQLRILPVEKTIAEVNHPTFRITPPTNPADPARLRPGVPLSVELWVDNRSERVDRFRLSVLGLPADWQTKITYPRESSGSGLILEADSLGLNPGDRGQILLHLTPPQDAIAGSYVPTLRLYSQNNLDLSLLGMVYLQVEPIFLLQPALQILRNQVRRQPGLFEIQFVNSGNTPRQIELQVENLDESGSCNYSLSRTQVHLIPKGVERVRLEAIPQRWWRRPLLGAGRFLNFRVEIEDTEDHPLTLSNLQGNLIWLPRPWWQLLLAVLMALGAIGSLIFLIWWAFLRPPLVPRIISFDIRDGRYAAANQDSARVAWQIEHPQRVKELTLTGYSPEGTILSGPYTYDLADSIPNALQPFCSIEDALLWCENVETGAREPGQYQFELSVTPKGRQPDEPIVEQSSSVVIDPKPQPQIVDFFPSTLIYVEPGLIMAANTAEATIPPITEKGIELNWIIDHPQNLAAIKLVGRDASGKVLGTMQYEMLPGGQIPERLQDWCRVGEQLFCEKLPTPIYEVGEYQFELYAIPIGVPETEVEPIATELITIQPQGSQILAFQVNGASAQPKHRIPVDQDQPNPTVLLSWEIMGGDTTTATLSPVPGDVALTDAISLPLDPDSSTTFTLQVQDATGESFTRSVTIETYDPTPADPNQAIADAFSDALGNLMGNGDEEAEEAAPTEPALGSPDTAEPGVVSPSELPPQFGR